jgi:hypothetical protein
MTVQPEAEPLMTADLATEAAEVPAVSLLDHEASTSFQQRWADTQTRFVDDPRWAVKEADALVADLMRSLAQGFAEHRSSLEEQWRQDAEPDTEQLRLALQRYRLLFSRLLSA